MSVFSSVFSLLVLLPFSSGTFRLSSIEFGRRTQRDFVCTDDQYLYDSKCCINCPAGKHVTSHCSTSGAKGQCEECDYGTYTEHPNGLNQCLKCTKCRPDQEIVRMCTSTEDTECQCKAGKFCDPHQACEECKTCSKCGEGEEVARNCTSTSNTECKKIQPSPGSASANKGMIILYVCIGLAVVVAGVVAGVICYKRCRSPESQLDQSEGLKVVQVDSFQPSAEVRRSRDARRLSNSKLVRAISSDATEDMHMLCESPCSSSSNSQRSLTGPPAVVPVLTLPNTALPWTPSRRDLPHLTPVNGEESLRKCFEYFEKHVEFDQHKRFFRHLGISDNVIKGKENLSYDDKIHELLSIWMEHEGREASLDHLLQTLLRLDQKRTAQVIALKAIANGHYVETPEV